MFNKVIIIGHLTRDRVAIHTNWTTRRVLPRRALARQLHN